MTTTIPYVRIPPEAFAIARRELTKAQYDVWTYLCEIDLYGDRLRNIPNPAKIAADLGLHERTVTRACDKLEDVGLFKFKINHWQGINTFGSKSEQAKAKLAEKFRNTPNEDSGCCDTFVQNLTGVSKNGHSDPKIDTDVQKMTQRSNFGQDCQNQGSKAASEAGFTPSNNSLITINNSLTNAHEQNLHEPLNERGEEIVDFSEDRQEKNFDRETENVESVEATLKIVQESLNQKGSYKADLEAEGKPESVNKGEDHFSAAPPEKFFKTLRDFVIYEAKADPKINAPEIWADTVIRRNRDDWQAKWEAWEKSRAQTSTYVPPKVEISADPEVRRRAVEEAKKLLPLHMRRNRG
jgi:hypothetical protein